MIQKGKKGAVKTYKVLKKAVTQFINDDSLSYSSAIAFYTIFSLPAVLIIVILISGTAYGEESAKTELMRYLSSFMGTNAANDILGILEQANKSEDSQFAKILGIGTLTFSATTVFVSIQNALNKIWGVKPKPKKGVVKFMVNRLLSFSLVLVFGVLMATSLLVEAALNLFHEWLQSFFNNYTLFLLDVVNFLSALIIGATVFACIFKILPDAVVKWRDVWSGAFFTSLLFLLGKLLIGLYLAESNIKDTYGAAGSLVAVLIWVYYSSAILLLGGEFTQVISVERGKMIRPRKGSVRVETKEVSKKGGGSLTQNSTNE